MNRFLKVFMKMNDNQTPGGWAIVIKAIAILVIVPVFGLPGPVQILHAQMDILQSQSATEIVQQMDQRMRGESSYAEMTMTIVRPRYTREVAMNAWALGSEYSLILITDPARDEGTAYLKRGNEIWNYVPTIDRTIKMPPSMMSQSWMGSDFTNDDLVRESSVLTDYSHLILREETYSERDCWVIELMPLDGAAVVWGRVLVWVEKENYMQLRVENYDQSDELASTIELDQIVEMDGRMFPRRMTMIPADEPDHQTVMTYEQLDFNIDIEESFFSQPNMRRVR